MRIVKIILCLMLLALALSLYSDDGKALTDSDELLFCVTGDSRGGEDGINKKIVKKMVNAIKKEKPSFVVVNGDLVSGYSSELEKELTNWRDTFMAPLLDADIKVYSCRGNHDAANGELIKNSETTLQIWQHVFSGKFAFPDNGPEGEKGVTYFVENKNVLMLILDSYTPKMKNQVNTKWIKEVIAKEKGTQPMHIFAAAHEPAFATKHKDCLASKPKERDEFLDIFLSNGGVCFFCGHDHFYNHAKVELPTGEFHQFICGTSGAPLYKWKGKYEDKRVVQQKTKKAFGYMTVQIKGKEATLTMKGWNKKDELETIDAFSYMARELTK